jgi:preprotein translocase subunit SecG
MYDILLVIYLIVAIAVVGLVMIQQGKGAEAGASFGAGASGTVFGSGGSGNFLTRMTSICALLFFVISLALSNMGSGGKLNKGNNWSDLQAPTKVEKSVSSDAVKSVETSNVSTSSAASHTTTSGSDSSK